MNKSELWKEIKARGIKRIKWATDVEKMRKAVLKDEAKKAEAEPEPEKKPMDWESSEEDDVLEEPDEEEPEEEDEDEYEDEEVEEPEKKIEMILFRTCTNKFYARVPNLIVLWHKKEGYFHDGQSGHVRKLITPNRVVNKRPEDFCKHNGLRLIRGEPKPADLK